MTQQILFETGDPKTTNHVFFLFLRPIFVKVIHCPKVCSAVRTIQRISLQSWREKKNPRIFQFLRNNHIQLDQKKKDYFIEFRCRCKKKKKRKWSRISGKDIFIGAALERKMDEGKKRKGGRRKKKHEEKRRVKCKNNSIFSPSVGGRWGGGGQVGNHRHGCGKNEPKWPWA